MACAGGQCKDPSAPCEGCKEKGMAFDGGMFGPFAGAPALARRGFLDQLQQLDQLQPLRQLGAGGGQIFGQPFGGSRFRGGFPQRNSIADLIRARSQFSQPRRFQRPFFPQPGPFDPQPAPFQPTPPLRLNLPQQPLGPAARANRDDTFIKDLSKSRSLGRLPHLGDFGSLQGLVRTPPTSFVDQSLGTISDILGR